MSLFKESGKLISYDNKKVTEAEKVNQSLIKYLLEQKT